MYYLNYYVSFKQSRKSKLDCTKENFSVDNLKNLNNILLT